MSGARKPQDVVALRRSTTSPWSKLIARSPILRRWRATRADAEALIHETGEHAYVFARERARSARETGNGAGFRHWSKVAVRIARTMGHAVGEKTADRYLSE